MKYYILPIIAFFAFFGTATAQELYQDLQGVWRAEVVEVLQEGEITVPGTEVVNTEQELSVMILEGDRRGEIVTFLNDFIILDEGDKFYMNYLITINGDEIFSVREVDRFFPMLVILGIFVITIIGFGGKQGVRSLLSLVGSLLVITYLLVPSLVSGYPPVPTSIVLAAFILFFAIFFTHGFNRRSSIAFLGTIIAVCITGILSLASIYGTGLTGIASDESLYLNLSTKGELDFVGLLLAAIIIGSLGVLDDIAITQVAVVRELFEIKELTKWDVYKKAIRVGREHVGALVNTLVLAYTGAALPLLLLFSLSDGSIVTILNREVFASEIVRALVGSIGLILTVPITTLLAVMILEKYRDEKIENDQEAHHTHAHHL